MHIPISSASARYCEFNKSFRAIALWTSITSYYGLARKRSIYILRRLMGEKYAVVGIFYEGANLHSDKWRMC